MSKESKPIDTNVYYCFKQDNVSEIKQKCDSKKDLIHDLMYHIADVATVCYKKKSININIINNLINKGHTSVLEHGTVYLKTNWWNVITNIRFILNPYSKVHNWTYITTNYRVIVENKLENVMFKFITIPRKGKHELRYTFYIETSRAISEEIIRHRSISPTKESTRFVEYGTKDCPFEFSIPANFELDKNDNMHIIKSFDVNNLNIDIKFNKYDYISYLKNNALLSAMYYRLSRLNNVSRDNSRKLLPLSLRCSTFHTAFISDWKKFINLRYYKVTGRPDYDITKIAETIKNLLKL